MEIGLKGRAGFGAAFALLVGVWVSALLQTYVWEGSVAWVSHTFELLGQLNELARQNKELENAQRAFLGHLARRGRTEEASAEEASALPDLFNRIDLTISEIRRLTADNPQATQNSDKLRDIAVLRSRIPGVTLPGAFASQWKQWTAEYASGDYASRTAEILEALQTQQRGLLRLRIARQSEIASLARSLFGLAGLLSFLLTFFALRQANAEVRRRRAEDRSLAAREEQYRQVIERAGDLIFRTDHLGRFTFCNHATLTTLQLTEQEVMGRSYLKLVRMDWRKQVRSFYLRQFARVHRNTYYEFPVLDGHGRERWLGQNVQLLQEGDRVVGFQGIAREITEHKQAEFESRKRREFVERVAEATPGILYVYDLDEHRNVYCNREIVSVLGHLPEIVKDLCREGGDHFHPDDMPAIRSHHESLRYAQDGEVRRIEYRVHHANGKWVWLASRDTPFERASNGLVKRIVGIAHDVTARKAAQEQLTYLANYDALTGLPNRQHFRTGLQSVLRRAGIEHGVASLCILGVDGFRETNDLFGRAAGDEVLEAVGNIMRSELRPQDLTARWGSHEFCVLLPGTEKEEALLVAERLRSCLGALAFGTASGSGRFSVTATLGVAEWRPNMQPHDLLEAADRAFYRARSSAHRKAFVTAC